MQINVVGNAKRNLIAGIVGKVIVMFCPFVERFAVQRILGVEYLGLGSLYSSVLSVLCLSELGFSTAMVYNMYKPAAEGDVEKMDALLNFYRKVYRVIGVAIILLGLAFIPFLPGLIKDSYPADINLISLYLIYLANTSLSYFLYAYLSSLIVVHQREDINSVITAVVKIGLTASQIAALLVTRNYYWLALMMPVFTILNNLLIAWRVRSIFPQYKAKGKLDAGDVRGIKKLVAGTFIQSACAVTRNSLDSICISAFLGLVLTGVYNNYFLVMSGVNAFVGLITMSFMGGVGNHVATRDVEANYQEMKRLDFIYLWIGGWCMICLLCLYQPFMKLWMGEDMLLPMSAVGLICLYFYLLKLGDVRSMYHAANGLWWEHRYRAVCETVLNLVLNISLGKLFGVHGIILATIISLFFCNYIWGCAITFRLYFKKEHRRDYHLYQGTQSFLVMLVAAMTYGVCVAIPVEGALMQLLVRAVICVLLPNVIFFLAYRKTDSFQYLKGIVWGK